MKKTMSGSDKISEDNETAQGWRMTGQEESIWNSSQRETISLRNDMWATKRLNGASPEIILEKNDMGGKLQV